MKKLLVCLVVLAFLLVPAIANGNGLPAGAAEVEHWEMVDNAWVKHSENDPASLARCWASTPANNGSGCNKQTWELDVKVHASVAQWLKYNMTGTRWDWRILKPGIYAADCVTMTVWSNNDVAITFSGFGDLEYQAEGGVERKIPIWYSWGQSLEGAEKQPGWTSAADLNGCTWTIPDGYDLHVGWWTKLWNKIEVVNCNSSCEYENSAKMHFSVTNLKPWVDPTTGGWLDLIGQ